MTTAGPARGPVAARPRAAVIGLDSVPHGTLRRLPQDGTMPRPGRMGEAGSLHRMDSVYPTVSSAAWASFATGATPGRQDICGFVDRAPCTYDLYFPNARNLPAPTLWRHLDDHGRWQAVISVPLTYPARRHRGVTVGCYLGTDIEKGSTDPAPAAPPYSIVDLVPALTDILGLPRPGRLDGRPLIAS